MEINSLKDKTLIKTVIKSGQDIIFSMRGECYWKFDNISINNNKNNDISFTSASFIDDWGNAGDSFTINRTGYYKMSGQVTVSCPESGMFSFAIQEFKIDEEGRYNVISTMLNCDFPVTAGRNTFVLPESIFNLTKGITISVYLAGRSVGDITVKALDSETFLQIESI